MRNEFFPYLYELMKKNPNIWALTGDLGYIGFNKIRDEMPDRFVNIGAAEQSLLDIAVGLALKGKKVFCYSITPFILYRAFETIRTYIDHEDIPVVLIGSGRKDDYKHDGFSHYAGDDKQFMKNFKNIISRWPIDTEDMQNIVDYAVVSSKPYYINLSKK